MIRALPASIRLSNGQTHSILWGLPQRSKQKETLMVGHALKHQSAVDVSVVGVRVTEELPYTAELASIFPDGSRVVRTVEGVLQRRYLNNIRPEYSRVYRIKDSIFVTAKPSTGATERTRYSADSAKSSADSGKSWNQMGADASAPASTSADGSESQAAVVAPSQVSSSGTGMTSRSFGSLAPLVMIASCSSWWAILNLPRSGV